MFGVVIDSKTGKVVREATPEEQRGAVEDLFCQMRSRVKFYGYNVPSRNDDKGKEDSTEEKV